MSRTHRPSSYEYTTHLVAFQALFCVLTLLFLHGVLRFRNFLIILCHSIASSYLYLLVPTSPCSSSGPWFAHGCTSGSLGRYFVNNLKKHWNAFSRLTMKCPRVFGSGLKCHNPPPPPNFDDYGDNAPSLLPCRTYATTSRPKSHTVPYI